eukprot:8544098-Karenia_brevis.AAC.1
MPCGPWSQSSSVNGTSCGCQVGCSPCGAGLLSTIRALGACPLPLAQVICSIFSWVILLGIPLATAGVHGGGVGEQ